MSYRRVLRLDSIRTIVASARRPRPRADRWGPMPRRSALDTGVPWIELPSTPEDWKAADPALLATMLGAAAPDPRVRGDGARAGRRRVSSTAPRTPASGRRAARSDRSSGSAPSDAVNGSHRGHHQFLAKAITHVGGRPLDLDRPRHPRDPGASCSAPSPRSSASPRATAGGRGGSMHLQWLEAGALGTNAIVGGGAPIAAGNAWAQKHSGTTDVIDQLLRRRRQPDRLGARDR